MKTHYTKLQSKEEIRKLVEQFQDDFGDRRNPQMKEAQLEDTYIKPLFSFLNWNIHTTGIKKGMEEFRVQTSQRIKKSTKQPDYELWLPEKDNHAQMKRHLFMEAKDPKYDLQKSVQWMRQAYQYAHSTLSLSERSNKRTNLSILTDFEEFRLFDCRDPYPLTKNDASLYNKYVIKKFDLRFTEYIDKFDLLWETFERNNVQNGSLSKFEITDKELKKNRIAPDLKFLDDLKQWRLDFARSMYKSNKSVSNEHLTSATQTLINRIIFLKMLTDREIEDDYLTKILERIENESEEISIYDSCRDIFKELDKKYNGDIFHRKTDLDDVIVENKVFKKILKSLRPEKSVYTLNAMPVEIIGNAYEQFLGDVIVRSGRGIAAEPKPEVRKAGGVYYTPKFIVDFIIKNTVGEKLKKCNSPKDVSEIKIVDPACGSGSFLLGAYDVLVDWHLNYFKHQVDKLIKSGKALNQINKKYIKEIKCYPIDSDSKNKEYTLHLTSKIKKQVLTNNLFGVDIDNNAVEITKFSLSMKALENTTHDELYEDYDLFNQTLLPELGNNIKCGNSLIGTDYFVGKIQFDIEERKKVNAFDWEDEFVDIFKNGGFDCVIGNPPWIDIKGLPKSDVEYYFNKYDATFNRMNIFVVFTEKALNILSQNGKFSYIIPNSIISQSSYSLLRKIILDRYHIDSIVRVPDNVFKGVVAESVIITIENDISQRKTNTAFFGRTDHIDRIDFSQAVLFNEINQKIWEEQKNYYFNIFSAEYDLSLCEKVFEKGIPLEKITRFTLGITPYDKYKGHSQTQIKDKVFHANKKLSKEYRKLLNGGDINRYSLNWNGKKWLKYGNWLGAPRQSEFFKDKRILVRQIVSGNPLRIFSTISDDDYVNTQPIFNIILDNNLLVGIEYILGIFNSILMNYYHQHIYLDQSKATFQKILIQNAKEFPIRQIDFDNKKDKSRHDQMVVYVDTMLELNKELQKAKTEHETNQLQRQINATDKKIDKLVYKLYDLTPEEIKIVEESIK
jgi:hypothetical protein